MDPPPTPNGRSNILVVDDRAENLMALEAVLEPLDQHVISVSSGDEALKQVLKHDFAAILLDVQMPGVDGFETAALIRQRAKTKHVPIVFVTAIHRDNEAIKRGFELGAIDYFTKPFDPDVLRAKVRALVEIDKVDRRLNARIRDLEEQTRRMRGVVGDLEVIAYRSQQLEDEHRLIVELREANRLKDDLFAVIAHEFRNPLGVIDGLVSTLKEHADAIDETQRSAVLDTIERQTRRLSSLVENLLDGRRSFAAGRVTSVQLRQIAQTALEWIEDTYRDKDIDFRISIPPDTVVSADPTAMHLVLVNLFSNAVKFSPTRERVSVTARTDGDLVTVSITNVSHPLNDREREEMFKPFIRLDNDAGGDITGAGLGLYLVRRFVELYQGSVTVGSAGDNVTLTLQLPAAGERRVVDLREPAADLELE